ncbi:MAG: hypothetical protein ACKO3C_14375 [Betaproteobacteria bacterium]|nr:hypothetical protein [Betaproteobacteria bacterium]
MKRSLVAASICLFSGAALAGDCGGGKMKPTDAQAPAATKVAEAPKVRVAANPTEREGARLVAQNAATPASASQSATR